MFNVEIKHRKVNVEKLQQYGFDNYNENYLLHIPIIDGQMALTVIVDNEGNMHTELIDVLSGDEYVLHHVPSAVGAFVGRVRSEYEEKINEVIDGCYDPDVFKSSQTKEVIAYIFEKYGDHFEFLWPKSPENAIVRRRDNRKWYAAILTISRRKLGVPSDETVEVIDLRIRPEDIKATVDHTFFFPGFHMNKKHWITICLDGTVDNKEIFHRIDVSFSLAKKR